MLRQCPTRPTQTGQTPAQGQVSSMGLWLPDFKTIQGSQLCSAERGAWVRSARAHRPQPHTLSRAPELQRLCPRPRARACHVACSSHATLLPGRTASFLTHLQGVIPLQRGHSPTISPHPSSRCPPRTVLSPVGHAQLAFSFWASRWEPAGTGCG